MTFCPTVGETTAVAALVGAALGTVAGRTTATVDVLTAGVLEGIGVMPLG